MTAEGYLGGADALPFMLSLDPSRNLFARPVNIDLAVEVKQEEVARRASVVAEQKENELNVYNQRSEKRAALDEQLKANRLRNVAGKEPLSQSLGEVYHTLQPGVSLPQGKSIQANDAFFATPWRSLGMFVLSISMMKARSIELKHHPFHAVLIRPCGTGGSALLVWPLPRLGRLPDQPSLIRGHGTPITAFALSTVQPNLVASGASDAIV